MEVTPLNIAGAFVVTPASSRMTEEFFLSRSAVTTWLSTWGTDPTSSRPTCPSRLEGPCAAFTLPTSPPAKGSTSPR